jgi:hypothetical protein
MVNYIVTWIRCYCRLAVYLHMENTYIRLGYLKWFCSQSVHIIDALLYYNNWIKYATSRSTGCHFCLAISGGGGVKQITASRLTTLRPVAVFLIPRVKFWDSALNQVTAASFHIPYNSSFINPIILCYVTYASLSEWGTHRQVGTAGFLEQAVIKPNQQSSTFKEWEGSSPIIKVLYWIRLETVHLIQISSQTQ